MVLGGSQDPASATRNNVQGSLGVILQSLPCRGLVSRVTSYPSWWPLSPLPATRRTAAEPSAEFVACIASVKAWIHPVREVFSSPFYRWENRGLERQSWSWNPKPFLGMLLPASKILCRRLLCQRSNAQQSRLYLTGDVQVTNAMETSQVTLLLEVSFYPLANSSIFLLW